MPFPAFHRAAQVLNYLSLEPESAWTPRLLAQRIEAPEPHIRSVMMALAVAGLLDGDALRGYRMGHHCRLTLGAILRAVRGLDGTHCPAAEPFRDRLDNLAAEHFHDTPLPRH